MTIAHRKCLCGKRLPLRAPDPAAQEPQTGPRTMIHMIRFAPFYS